MTWEFFDKYLEDKGDFGECVSNHKNKMVVYKEEIEGSLYYIKKYIPYGKRKIRVAFGLLNDRSKHYRKVTNILEKINLPYVKLEYAKIRKKSFFERTSIIVTKDAGDTFEKYLINFEKNKGLIKSFYNFFIILVKNKIYPIDYNTGGMLVDKNGIARLTDFDDYRTNTLLTLNLKKRLLRNLHRIYLEEKRTKECEEFLKTEIKNVVRQLGWENLN